jgi:hypothetical protein
LIVNTADLLEVLRPGLGVLTREPADADHPSPGPEHQHEAHLEEDLELGGDRRRGALVQTLRAIAALEQERLAARRLGELALERFDLPRGHQRRQPPEGGESPLERRRIAVDRLLIGREALPGFRRPARLRAHAVG